MTNLAQNYLYVGKYVLNYNNIPTDMINQYSRLDQM